MVWGIIFFVMALALVLIALTLYFPYRSSPERLWRDRVRQLEADLRARVDREDRSLRIHAVNDPDGEDFHRTEARLRAAREQTSQVGNLVRIANNVTFLRHAFAQPHTLVPGLLQGPLPNPDAVVSAADEKARDEYARYRKSPEKRFRDGVLSLAASARQSIDGDRQTAHSSRADTEHQIRALNENAFPTYLSTIPISELEKCAGVGPATVEKLRYSGYSSLRSLIGARLNISGIGEKKSADINAAVAAIHREAESRFRSGACREAQELVAKIDSLRRKCTDIERRSEARIRAAELLIARLKPYMEAAEPITFSAYLKSGGKLGVSPALLASSLPDLNGDLIRAEHPTPPPTRTVDASPVARPPQLSSGTDAPPDPHRAAEPRAVPPRVVAAAAAAPIAPPTPATPPNRDLFRAALESVPAIRPEFPPPARGPAPGSSALSDAAREEAKAEVLVQLAYSAARSDGRIAAKETAVIDEHLQSRYAADAALLGRIRSLCAYYRTAAIDVEACLVRVCELFSVEERRTLLQWVTRILDSSGGISAREAGFLELVCGKLDPDARPAGPTAVPRTAASASAEPQGRAAMLQILELDSTMPLSADLIRRSWRRLSERYGEERIAGMGPEFVEMARAKSAAIKAAADALISEFNEELEPARPSPENPALRHNPDLDAMFGD